jgi:hypothetical protein
MDGLLYVVFLGWTAVVLVKRRGALNKLPIGA